MARVAGFLRNLYIHGRKKETSFGSDSATGLAVADFQMFRVSSDPFSFVVDIQDDVDITGGSEGATEAEIYAKRLEGPMDQPRVKPHTLATIGGFGLGAVTSSTDSNGRKHTFSPIESYSSGGLDLPTFTAVQDHSVFQKWHTGILVNSFTLQTDRKGYLQFSSGLLGSGKRYNWSTDMSGATEQASEPWMKAGNAKIWLHRGYRTGTYDGSIAQSKATDDLTGYPEDISGRITSFKWSYDNGLSGDDLYRFESGLTMGAGERVRRSQTLSLQFEMSSEDSVEDLAFSAHLDGDTLGTLSDGSDVPGTATVAFGTDTCSALTTQLANGLVFSDADQTHNVAGGNVLSVGVGTTVNASDHMGDCLVGNGSGYASITDASQSGLDMSTSDFMLEGWIKYTNPAAQRLMSKHNTVLAGYDVYVNGNNRLGAGIRDAGGLVSATDDGAALNNGEWHHVAVVYDRSGNMTRYVDGAVYGSADDISGASLTVDNGVDFAVGSTSQGGQYFNGSLDEVRVWDYGVGGLPADIATIIADHYRCPYELSPLSSDAQLVGRWKFDGDYTDETANSNDLTAGGSGNSFTDNHLVTPLQYHEFEPHQGTILAVLRPNWDSTELTNIHQIFDNRGSSNVRNRIYSQVYSNTFGLYMYDDDGTLHRASMTNPTFNAGDTVFYCARWNRNETVDGTYHIKVDAGKTSVTSSTNGPTSGGWIWQDVEAQSHLACNWQDLNFLDATGFILYMDEPMTDAEVTAWFNSGSFTEPRIDHRVKLAFAGTVTSEKPDIIQWPQTTSGDADTHRNLVSDGNMEGSGVSDWAVVGSAERMKSSNPGGSYAGRQGLTVRAGVAANSGVEQFLTARMASNQDYLVGVWYKVDTGSHARVLFYDPVSGSEADVDLSNLSSSEWTFAEGVYQTGTMGTPAVRLLATDLAGGSTDDVAVFDSVRVHRSLATNGGMEYWTGNNPDSWTETGTPNSSDMADSHSGDSSCYLATGGAGSYIQQTISVNTDSWYTVTGWVKALSGTNYFRLYDGAAELKNISFTGVSWTKKQWTFKADDGELRIRLYSETTASALYDDISVVKLDSVPAANVTATAEASANSYQDKTYGKARLIDGQDTLSWPLTGRTDEGTYLIHFYPNWRYDSELGRDRVLFHHRYDGTNYVDMYWDVSEQKWVFRTRTTAGGVSLSTSAAQTFSYGTGITLVGTYGPNGRKLYVNGTVVSEVSAETNALATAPDTLYAHDYAGARIPNVYLDEVVFFDDEKTAAEVAILSDAVSNLGADPLRRLEFQKRGALELECFGTGNAIAAGSTYYGANVIFPDLQYESVVVTALPGTKKVVNVEAKVLEDTDSDDYSSVYMTVWNSVYDYLT